MGLWPFTLQLADKVKINSETWVTDGTYMQASGLAGTGPETETLHHFSFKKVKKIACLYFLV
jgi:hypothetical protein